MNNKAIKTVAVTLMLAGQLALAAPRPILSSGPMLSEAQEAANELGVLRWHRNVMGGDRNLALSLMDRNFIQHDVEEPSGSEEFLGFFSQVGGPPGTNGGDRSPAYARIKADYDAARAAGQPWPAAAAREPRPMNAQTRLFGITDGQLSVWAYTSRGGDPGRFFGGNMARMIAGKVVEEWYSGPTFNVPADVPTVSDFSAWYPLPYREVAEVKVQYLLSAAITSRAQREANKKLVADFVDEFFNRQRDVAATVLAPNLVTHIEGIPAGMRFAEYARALPDKVTSRDTSRTLFLLSQGDLVAIGFPVTLLGDPGAWYAMNLARVRGGKIVEWWYSGYPVGSPWLRYGAAWPVGKGPRPGIPE